MYHNCMKLMYFPYLELLYKILIINIMFHIDMT